MVEAFIRVWSGEGEFTLPPSDHVWGRRNLNPKETRYIIARRLRLDDTEGFECKG